MFCNLIQYLSWRSKSSQILRDVCAVHEADIHAHIKKPQQIAGVEAKV